LTEPAIAHGSTVRMHYTLALENGTVVDGTAEDEPLRFTMGDGTLVEGLELALFGLKAGDRQTLRLDPREAFGPRDATNVHALPRAEFPAEMPLEPGLIVGFTTPAGDEVPGTVLEVDEQEVLVDFNHPLAGHEITFDVHILEVTSDK
jgi:FKBP-type peptidyl-prolyl cis-trans isomerase SlpA